MTEGVRAPRMFMAATVCVERSFKPGEHCGHYVDDNTLSCCQCKTVADPLVEAMLKVKDEDEREAAQGAS